MSNETIPGSAARIDLGTEQLFTVAGQPREAWRPRRFLAHAKHTSITDPVLAAIGW